MTAIKIQGSGDRADFLTQRMAADSPLAYSKVGDADKLRTAHAAAKAEYTAKRDKLEKTTQDFEAMFIGMMLKKMRQSVAGQNALFGNSSEAKTYQDMADDATAQKMSKVGTFGLARVLFKSMSRALPPDPDKE